MAEHIVLTAIGHDRPGIVDKVSKKVAAHEGNVETSRMARLGGEFAMLALLTIPDEMIAPLAAALEGLDEEGLFTKVAKTDLVGMAEYQGFLPYEVIVYGADHRGIIHEVSHFLAERHINIESMDTRVTAAPMSGAPLFSLKAVVFAPPDTTLRMLREELDNVGRLLAVDIDVDPYTG